MEKEKRLVEGTRRYLDPHYIKDLSRSRLKKDM